MTDAVVVLRPLHLSSQTGTALAHSRDPYVLRSLLWCGLCGYRMHPLTMAGGGVRAYACPLRCRGLADAAATERRVDEAIRLRFPLLAPGIPAEYRASFNAGVLERVDMIGADEQLAFTWRTPGGPDVPANQATAPRAAASGGTPS